MNVIIVGGGPAGSSTAISILKRCSNATVMIFEKKNRGPPRCAGGVSTWMLDKVGLKIPKRVVSSEILKARIYSPDMNFLEFNTKGFGYVLDRGAFDDWLRLKAGKLGASFWYGNEHFWKKFWKVPDDFLVGADGPTSSVARWVGAPAPEDFYMCVQKTLVWKDYPEGLVSVYFGNVAPKGYAWVFPAGDEVRVGLGVPLSSGLNAGKLLERFMRKIGIEKIENSSFIGKLVPSARPRNSNVFGNVLLVGDAGLMTDPLTGGGICQAIASGIAAGRAIAEGKPENYDYYIRWLKRQNALRYRLKKVLCSLSDRELDRLVDVLKGFTLKTPNMKSEIWKALAFWLVNEPLFLLRKIPYFFL